MPHTLAQAVEICDDGAGRGRDGILSGGLVAARVFLRERRAPRAEFAPGVSILKSLKGLDPGMMDAFRSHCRQSYAGEFELLFGVSFARRSGGWRRSSNCRPSFPSGPSGWSSAPSGWERTAK